MLPIIPRSQALRLDPDLKEEDMLLGRAETRSAAMHQTFPQASCLKTIQGLQPRERGIVLQMDVGNPAGSTTG